MSFCCALCNPNNPHGCCHSDSDLSYIWFIPVAIITYPIWCPIFTCVVCCEGVINVVNNNIEWNKANNTNRDDKKYEVVDNEEF
jgi:hypothetical protein